jgi:hypothetical protein
MKSDVGKYLPAGFIIDVFDNRNKTVLLGELRRMRATRAEMKYEGYGDEGTVESVNVVRIPKGKDAGDAIALRFSESRKLDLFGHTREVRVNKRTSNLQERLRAGTKTFSVEEGFSGFAEALLEEHAGGGWDQGEGTSGFAEFDVRRNRIMLSHNEYVREAVTSSVVL